MDFLILLFGLEPSKLGTFLITKPCLEMIEIDNDIHKSSFLFSSGNTFLDE